MGKRITGEGRPSGASALDMFLTGVVSGALPSASFGSSGALASGSVSGIASLRDHWLTSRYRVQGLLGAGGMGLVLRCWDEWRQCDVALKLLRPDVSSSEGALDQLRQELHLQERCQHDGIVRTFDLGRLEGSLEIDGVSLSGLWFLAMELVEGRSLWAVLDDARQGGSVPLLPWSVWSGWMASLIDVLAYAHEKGVIHRDLKPSNLILLDDDRVKLLDFGIAALRDDGPDGTSSGAMARSAGIGTAYYMAPEQLEAGRAITPAADVYALGVIVYELLTGRLPSGRFEGPWSLLSHDGIAPDFSQEVDDVVLTALAQRPEARFQSVLAFWDSLKAAMAAAVAVAPARSREPIAEGASSQTVGAGDARPAQANEPYSTDASGDSGDAENSGWRLETAERAYRFDEVMAEGDIATIWTGVVLSGPGKDDGVVAKIVDDPEDNDLMRDEVRALQLLRAGKSEQKKHLPVLLDQFVTDDGCHGVILKRFDGYDLEAVREAYPRGIPQEHCFWILRRALSVLGYAHSLGILHGNIEPTHLMLRPKDHNVLLLDWSYSLVARPGQRSGAFKCWNEIFSGPEVREQKPPVPGSDIYSLGQTMIDLLGGNLENGTLPSSVDDRLGRLLRYMTRKSALQRPRDAWELYHQVNKLRKTIFGKHKFIPFPMPPP